ncbi:hypothetical protein [Chryseobacterium sp. KLBC 52]|uniref:hypothetical protein n=1 Tax=Chryseobacterium sp. KLBC 52 TaxID=1862702 RepID=UPI000E0C81F8|nr:hypothetical protein [Chryseobacterium sp. KLBC 52]
MKKIFYILLVLGLSSCSSTNDEFITVNENQTEDLQPDKGYIFLMDQRTALMSPDKYYRFFYENGRLQKMLGRNYFVTGNSQFFYPDVITQLSYTNNKVQVDYLEPEMTSGYRTTSYLMEHNRPAKAEKYYKNGTIAELEMTRTYTYGSNTVSVYTKLGYQEFFTTYYFDANSNLSKSETLEKTSGKDKQFTTTLYSDFDNAKNPFKKLFLINDDFYEKSLSKNNFRAKESVTEYADYPDTGVPPQPGISKSKWTYNYDNNGQVLLYFPLQ